MAVAPLEGKGGGEAPDQGGTRFAPKTVATTLSCGECRVGGRLTGCALLYGASWVRLQGTYHLPSKLVTYGYGAYSYCFPASLFFISWSKRPSSEMLKYINKFKSDFGDQVVSLQRVQPSLDHVPHQSVTFLFPSLSQLTIFALPRPHTIILSLKIIQVLISRSRWHTVCIIYRYKTIQVCTSQPILSCRDLFPSLKSSAYCFCIVESSWSTF